MEPVFFGTFTKPTIRSKSQYSHSPPLDTPGLIHHHTLLSKSENRRRRPHIASFSVPTAPLRAKVGIPSPKFAKSYMCLALNCRSNPHGSHSKDYKQKRRRIDPSLGKYKYGAELMLSIVMFCKRYPTWCLLQLQLLMGSVIMLYSLKSTR